MKGKLSNLKMICSSFPAPTYTARDLRIKGSMPTQIHTYIFMATPVVMYIYMHICMQIWINGWGNLIKS